MTGSPFGMPLNGLQWQTGRTSLSTLPLPVSRPTDLGTNPSQPSQDDNAADALFDNVSQANAQPATSQLQPLDAFGQDRQTAQPADNNERKILISVQTEGNSNSAPIYSHPGAHLKDLKEALHHLHRIDPTIHSLSVGRTLLRPDVPLVCQGVSERTVITLHRS